MPSPNFAEGKARARLSNALHHRIQKVFKNSLLEYLVVRSIGELE